MTSVRIPDDYFVKIDKLTLKFIGNGKGLTIAKTILRKNKVGGFSLPDFKTYYKIRVIRTVWYWQDRHIDQWNRTKSPEVNQYICSQQIFIKGSKTIQWAKNSLFNKWCWDNWTYTCKKMKLNLYLTPYIKIKVGQTPKCKH